VPLYLGIEFIVQSDQYFIVFAKTSAPPWSFRGGSVPVVRYQFWDSDFEEIEGAASKRRRQDGVRGGFSGGGVEPISVSVSATCKTIIDAGQLGGSPQSFHLKTC